MATYKKKKINFKSIISFLLVIGTIVALGAGVTALAKDDTKTISSFGTYVRGTIDVITGEYAKSETSIVTEEMFSCYGLKITPDFDSDCDYQIFWYNMDKIPMGSTAVMRGVYVDKIPECAKYCRIVITPKLENKDDTIGMFEVSRVASSLKVEVAKDQTVLPINYFVVAQEQTSPDTYTNNSFAEEGFYTKYTFYNGFDFFPNYKNMVENIFCNEYSYEHSALVKLDCANIVSFKLFFEKGNDCEVRWTVIDDKGNVLGYEEDVSNGAGLHMEGDGTEAIIDITAMVPRESLSFAKYVVIGIDDVDKAPVINKYMPR